MSQAPFLIGSHVYSQGPGGGSGAVGCAGTAAPLRPPLRPGPQSGARS